MDLDQHDAALWACPPRQALHRFGTARALADDYLCGRSAPPSLDRAHGHRRADRRCDVSCLGDQIPVPNAPIGRHRYPRQPQQSQGDRRTGSDHRDGRKRALPAALFSRSQPHRKVLFQTQGTAPQSRQTIHRRPMEGNRRVARHRLPKRMHKLLRRLWICMHLK